MTEMTTEESQKGGYNTRISCKCANTMDFNEGNNKHGAIKKVGQRCRCMIGKGYSSDKPKKTFAVFVQQGDPNTP